MAAAAKFPAALNEPPIIVSLAPVKFRLLLLALFVFARGFAAETLADKTLRELIGRQQEMFARAAREGDNVDEARFQGEAQAIASSYEVFIQRNPDNAGAFAAYGIFLDKIGMARQAAAMLLKANKLDGENPVVKNQMGKLLAEDGKPVDALTWVTAAIQLEPKEPLYHYHLGRLLLEARDDFIKSGNFTRASLEHSMLGAFATATDLAPDNWEYALQRAKAYYDPPRWEEELALWDKLEEKAKSDPLRQLVRLHEARVLLNLGRRDEARADLEHVTDDRFTAEKQTLLDEIAKPVAK
jgi:tetratricopeptide (TPR) repeat protein